MGKTKTNNKQKDKARIMTALSCFLCVVMIISLIVTNLVHKGTYSGIDATVHTKEEADNYKARGYSCVQTQSGLNNTEPEWYCICLSNVVLFSECVGEPLDLTPDPNPTIAPTPSIVPTPTYPKGYCEPAISTDEGTCKAAGGTWHTPAVPDNGTCPSGQFYYGGICAICSAGHYCPGGNQGIQICEWGTYCPNNGMSSPYPCPFNHYCPSNGSQGSYEARPCPAGSTSGEGSRSIINCQCNPGTYMNMLDEINFTCKECSAGYFCPGGVSEPTKCPEGKTSPSGSDEERDCGAEKTADVAGCYACSGGVVYRKVGDSLAGCNTSMTNYQYVNGTCQPPTPSPTPTSNCEYDEQKDCEDANKDDPLFGGCKQDSDTKCWDAYGCWYKAHSHPIDRDTCRCDEGYIGYTNDAGRWSCISKNSCSKTSAYWSNQAGLCVSKRGTFDWNACECIGAQLPSDDSNSSVPADQSIGPTNSPGNATNSPGNATNSPGNATNSPGNATNQPGNQTNSPGNATNQPGNQTNSPSDVTQVCYICVSGKKSQYVRASSSTNAAQAATTLSGITAANCTTTNESNCTGLPVTNCYQCNGSRKFVMAESEAEAKSESGGDTCTIVTSNKCNPTPDTNPKTGTFSIIVAWIIGMMTIVYAMWYFRKSSLLNN